MNLVVRGAMWKILNFVSLILFTHFSFVEQKLILFNKIDFRSTKFNFVERNSILFDKDICLLFNEVMLFL